MRYPNLRYGNPNELRYYAQAMPAAELARRLRRDERTVRDYLSGRQRVPWWIPELLRLQSMEHAERMRQMGMTPTLRRLGLTTGDVIAFRSSRVEPLHAEALACGNDRAVLRGDRTIEHLGDMEKRRVIAG